MKRDQQLHSVSSLLELQAASFGQKPFLFFADRTISFTELNRNANRVAQGLLGLGAGKGTGVAIMMANSPEWLFVYFAIMKLNAYVVPVNIALKGDGLHHIIDHSDSRILIADPEFTEEIDPLRPNLDKLKHYILNDSNPGDGWRTLNDVMSGSAENPGIEIIAGEISAIMYTSGTTGAPKGVVSRYQPFPINTPGLGGVLREDDVLYTCLPLFHANALFLTTMRALTAGRPMVLGKRFSASRFWDEIRRYKVTTFNALGAMIPILMKQPERPNDADNPVHTVFSAACPASVWEAFEKRFGVTIIEGYASVDGGGFSVMNLGDAPKGSIGKPAHAYKLIDDAGKEVPVGESGELIFKVENEKLRRVEYYKNESASRAKIADGWLYTGDLLHADENGFLYFDDRKTDSMRRRGENISAWEVERTINSHPDVYESAVFGVPSELGEDDVMAVVIPKADTHLTEEELAQFCEAKMASFMVPRYIEFRSSLPKTGTHRVQKSLLKKQGIGPATWDREKRSKVDKTLISG